MVFCFFFFTLSVLILEKLLVPKKLYFFVFATCRKHPLSRSFTNTHFPDHSPFASEWNTKSYLRRCILLNKIVFFLLFFSQRSFFFDSMFSYTLVSTPTNYILKQKRCIEKDKFSEAAYLLKVSNTDTTEITESCSKWKYMTLLLCSYW